jgi:hypothetical protein
MMCKRSDRLQTLQKVAAALRGVLGALTKFVTAVTVAAATGHGIGWW